MRSCSRNRIFTRGALPRCYKEDLNGKVYVQTASFSRELREDFHGTLEQVAKAGYDGLELFDGIYGGYSAKDLKNYLASLGMIVIGAHIRMDQLEDELVYLPQTGCPYLVCPGLHVESREQAYHAAEQMNTWGKAVAQAGMKFGYHNHSSDFDAYGDETVIDIFIRNTDPSLVTFELDTAWAWRAGVNAADFVKRYSGRFELIHVKETSRVFGPEDDFHKLFAGVERDADGRPILTAEVKARLSEFRKINCKLGDGIINMPEFVKVADAQGAKAYVVEREYEYTGNIFTSIAEDLQYLKAL